MNKNDAKFCEDFTRYSHITKDLEKCIYQCDKCKKLEGGEDEK